MMRLQALGLHQNRLVGLAGMGEIGHAVRTSIMSLIGEDSHSTGR